MPLPPAEDVGGLPDHSSLHYLLGFNGPLEPRDAAEAQETIKAKVNSILKKLVQQVGQLVVLVVFILYHKESFRNCSRG
jgi:hypothetical protein